MSFCEYGIKPVFVFFDDCWNAESEFGVQPEPQSVSSGVWSVKYADNMGKYQLENSDIISYHDYSKVESVIKSVNGVQ